MKLFLDTANLLDIREAVSTGLVEGVTTDPVLIAKEGRGFEETIREIAALVDGPVAVATVSQGWEELVDEGRTLARLHRSVVVKIPMTGDGLRACRRLSHDGVKTMMTLLFSPVQALLASKAGATYVAPSIARVDDLGEDGVGVVEKILQIYNNYDLPTQVVVQGIRSPMHVLDAAVIGADGVSLPYDVFKNLLKHPLTEAGMRQAVDAWKKVPKN